MHIARMDFASVSILAPLGSKNARLPVMVEVTVLLVLFGVELTMVVLFGAKLAVVAMLLGMVVVVVAVLIEVAFVPRTFGPFVVVVVMRVLVEVAPVPVTDGPFVEVVVVVLVVVVVELVPFVAGPLETETSTTTGAFTV